MTRALFLLLTLACGPKKAPVVDQGFRATAPAPLTPRPFAIPDAERGTLSNGLPVLVVHNPEVPLFYVTLAFRDGAWTDPADRPGLAAAAMDLLNEGAGDLSAEALSLELKRLATELGTSAGPDGATITISGLKKNLEPSLDLLALVLTDPTMSGSEWELLRKQRLADLQTELEDPNAIARRVFWRVMMGQSYLGNLPTEQSLKAMTVEELRGWASSHLSPDRAVVLVGGDITLAEVQPLLEARLAGWKAAPGSAPAVPDGSVLNKPEKTTIYLVDKPSAAQSVLRIGRPVGGRTDADSTAFEMANDAVGGLFTSRINMNLRESKGYTYGARAWSVHNYGPDVWLVGTSVRADATVASLQEIMGELNGACGDRPIDAGELENVKGNALGTQPLLYETPGDLLGGLSELWRYNLPEDWLRTMPDRVRAVDLDAANAAWKKYVDPSQLVVVVVGDAASLREGLGGLGYPVVELDRDGKPINGG